MFSSAKKDLLQFIPEVHELMVRSYADMRIPLESSISFGRSFGPEDQIEIGSLPTKEAIEHGLSFVR